MATRKGKTNNGEYTGKLGTVVISPWRGIMTMRSLSKPRKKAKSAALIQQNELFKMVMQFLSEALPAIKVGFQLPRDATMTEMNAATSYHLLEAVVQDATGAYIDMAKVKFSKPMKLTQRAWKANVVAEAGRKIKFQWELNPFPNKSTQLDDKAVLVFYNDQTKKFSVINGKVDRQSMGYTYNVPDVFEGHDYFCYLFMRSTDGKLVAPTQYLGQVKVIA